MPDADLQRAADLLVSARAPAIIGLYRLSLEAIGLAITLAERLGATLVVGDYPSSPSPGEHPVSIVTTHAGARSSNLLILVNGATPPKSPDGESMPQTIMTMGGHLDDVLQLRAALENTSNTTPASRAVSARSDSPYATEIANALRNATRATVLLPHTIDPRTAGQWHALAADQQTATRIDGLHITHANAGNARGVAEVVAWRTGATVAFGAVDCSTNPPTPRRIATGGDALQAFDAVLEFVDDRSTESAAGTRLRVTHVTVTRKAASDAARTSPVRIDVPPTHNPTAARVMDADGVVRWSCDDPTVADTDPACAILEQLIGHIPSSTSDTGGDR